MMDKDFEISYPAIDPGRSYTNYILSIQILLDGFSFVIRDIVSNKFIFLKHTSIDDGGADLMTTLSDTVKTSGILSKPFKDVNIVFNSISSILIPNEFFKPEDAQTHLTLSAGVLRNEVVTWQLCESVDATLVYAMPLQIKEFVDNVWPLAHCFHSLQINLDIAQALQQSQKRSVMLINAGQTSVSIVCCTANQLNYANTFNVTTHEDFVYYVMLVAKELNLDTKATSVIFQGLIERNDPRIVTLSRYLHHITFTPWPEGVNFYHGIYNIPAHYFSNLYSVI